MGLVINICCIHCKEVVSRTLIVAISVLVSKSNMSISAYTTISESSGNCKSANSLLNKESPIGLAPQVATMGSTLQSL